jgi:hypothetical protein
LLVALPCLTYGFPYYGDDSVSNAILVKEFAGQFWSGELYPRWLQGLNAGLGNPTSFYYPPVAYWLTSLFKFLSGNDVLGWRQLGISAALAVVASGVVVFYWLRKDVGPGAALIASLVYLLLPYHVNIDLYTRGTLAELWTFVWMPLVIYAVDAVCARERFAVAGLAIAYALLVMTHLPTTLIFSLVPVAYSIYAAPADQRRRSFVLTVSGMSLGIGISAIYLLPAMTMQDFIFHTTQGIGGHYYYGNWFLFTNLRWYGAWSVYFIAATGVMFLAALAFFIVRLSRTNARPSKATIWFVVALSSFFMMTPLSRPVWQLLPTLQKIQFPFRFNTVLTLATTALVAFAVSHSRGRGRKLFAAALVIFAGVSIYSLAQRAYYSYPAHYVDQRIIESTNNRFARRRDTNEFRPRWVVSIEEAELEVLLGQIGTTSGELNKVSVVPGNPSISIQRWLPREIEFHLVSKSDVSLNVSQFYFPGWSVRLNNGEAKATQPSKPGGLIRIDVPSGEHKVTLRLEKRWPEVAGELITTGSSIVLVVLLLASRRFRFSAT